jgi:hypothetical protein
MDQPFGENAVVRSSAGGEASGEVSAYSKVSPEFAHRENWKCLPE